MKKDTSQLKMLDIGRGRRKILKKEKEKWKMTNSETTTRNIFFTLTLLYRKTYILLENIFGKT